MMNNIKHITKLAIVLVLFTNSASAQLVGSGFNYQGELNFDGASVNTNHVFTLRLFDALSGGNQIGSDIIRGGAIPPFIPENGIPVNDGLFNLSNLDFGDQYTGDELWLEVTVKALDPVVCGGGAFPPCPIPVTLSPRQRIHAVPYAVQADFIGPNFDISIGTTISTHRLTVESDTDNRALRLIGDIGGFGAGARLNFGDGDFAYIDEPTDDDLRIKANELEIDADVKQPITSNGVMKYMVHASCGGSTPSIIKSYNGIDNNINMSIIPTSPIIAGGCIIDFPESLQDRYWQVSAVYAQSSGGSRTATCRNTSPSALFCTRTNSFSGSLNTGEIMILVY